MKNKTKQDKKLAMNKEKGVLAILAVENWQYNNSLKFFAV
jgi:hypothetical protein